MAQTKTQFGYRRHPDQDRAGADVAEHAVVVVGAGPVGLSLAIDLAQRGQSVVLLDDADRIGEGSRAICFSKRSLEFWDRLGIGQRMVDKGVVWSVGKIFHGEQQLYQFNLLPEEGHKRPAFINLQQFYAEAYLVDRVGELPAIDLRWRNKVTGLEPRNDHVLLTIQTPDGPYRLNAQYVIACDGARSSLRQLVGAEFAGQVFEDQFLIADVKMTAAFPTERWFWFDPPFHPGQSVLLHMQPDGVWRIDFQLGWDADPEQEKRPENIIPRVQEMLAHTSMKDVPFELEWASVYTFACLRMDEFRHGRVLFAGDSAHGVSPFGARGANSGVQDAENLAWKLAAVLQGQAPDKLLDTYGAEREYAADENILNSTRATDFITPKSEISRLFRDAVLDLAKTHDFARTLVNSGRLSVPATLHASPLNTPVAEPVQGRMVPGAPAADAPVQLADGRSGWLLRQLGAGFTALVAVDAQQGAAASDLRRAVEGLAPLKVLTVARDAQVKADLIDRDGLLAQRYDLQPGGVVLLRPDQHVCARWTQADPAALRVAMQRALAHH